MPRRIVSRRLAADWRAEALRTGLLAWTLVTLLVVIFGANPHAAEASPLALHGALHRADAIGIVAHRGAAAAAPENTLAATRVGIEQGVEFLEADVQLTADGVPILMHDPEVDRTTNGSGAVADLTLAEIRALDAGSWFRSEFAGERVPTLEEFVALLAQSPARALVELKGEWTHEQLHAVAELLRSNQMVNRIALQSFEVDTLQAMRETAPEFALVMLTREWDDDVVRFAIELQVSAVGARTELYDERPDLIERVQPLGIGVLAYTLNDEPQWQAATELGIDFVVTDDPVGLDLWREG